MTPQNSGHSDVAQQAMQDFVERMQDPLIAMEDVRIEVEAICTIGAVYGQRFSAKAERAHTLLKQTRRKQLRILVDGEFYQMLKDCDLGAGLPDASRVGWQILSERLKRPSEDVQQQLTAALEAALALDKTQTGIPDSIYLQVRNALRALLSEQDWEAISSAAITAIQTHFKQQIAEAKAT